MSNFELKEPYVYQPYGSQDKENWKSGLIYGVGGVSSYTTIKGLTREEAEKIVEILKQLRNT